MLIRPLDTGMELETKLEGTRRAAVLSFATMPVRGYWTALVQSLASGAHLAVKGRDNNERSESAVINFILFFFVGWMMYCNEESRQRSTTVAALIARNVET